MSVRQRFQEEFGQSIEQAQAEADRLLDRQKAMADAIVLERAARVLERRDRQPGSADERSSAAWAFLVTRGKELRQEAERG